MTPSEPTRLTKSTIVGDDTSLFGRPDSSETAVGKPLADSTRRIAILSQTTPETQQKDGLSRLKSEERVTRRVTSAAPVGHRRSRRYQSLAAVAAVLVSAIAVVVVNNVGEDAAVSSGLGDDTDRVEAGAGDEDRTPIDSSATGALVIDDGDSAQSFAADTDAGQDPEPSTTQQSEPTVSSLTTGSSTGSSDPDTDPAPSSSATTYRPGAAASTAPSTGARRDTNPTTDPTSGTNSSATSTPPSNVVTRVPARSKRNTDPSTTTSTTGSRSTSAKRTTTTNATVTTKSTTKQTTTTRRSTTRPPTTTTTRPPTTSTTSSATTSTTLAVPPTASTTTTTERPTTTVPTGSSGTVIWEENFNSLDPSVWRVEHSTYGDGNNELQCYRPENVSVSNGKLVLRAVTESYTCPNGSTRQVTSGMIRSQGVTFSPGQAIEFRVKLNPADRDDQGGLWPAVWASGWAGGWPAGGEMDWLEVMTAENARRAMFSVHYADPSGSHKHQNRGVIGSDYFSDSWHTVRFDYGRNGRMTWYLDGVKGFEVDAAETLQGFPAPFDQTVREIKINLALGGRPGPLSSGAVGSAGASFEMDYIRILQL